MRFDFSDNISKYHRRSYVVDMSLSYVQYRTISGASRRMYANGSFRNDFLFGMTKFPTCISVDVQFLSSHQLITGPRLFFDQPSPWSKNKSRESGSCSGSAPVDVFFPRDIISLFSAARFVSVVFAQPTTYPKCLSRKSKTALTKRPHLGKNDPKTVTRTFLISIVDWWRCRFV